MFKVHRNNFRIYKYVESTSPMEALFEVYKKLKRKPREQFNKNLYVGDFLLEVEGLVTNRY